MELGRAATVFAWLEGVVMRKKILVRGDGTSRQISDVECWYREQNQANLRGCEECMVTRKKPEVGVVLDMPTGRIDPGGLRFGSSARDCGTSRSEPRSLYQNRPVV